MRNVVSLLLLARLTMATRKHTQVHRGEGELRKKEIGVHRNGKV
jgi:hypothetical protein